LTVLPNGASLLAPFMFFTKRVYEPPEAKDGKCFLVDRLWPRGLSKKAAQLDGWIKDIAPSDQLRKWFNHEPAKWDEFRKRYFAELKEKAEALEPLREATRKGTVTLLFGAKDYEHNNAVALKDFLAQLLNKERRLQPAARKTKQQTAG
jgi:uncharacterized protein YeaO (DUF488 family)